MGWEGQDGKEVARLGGRLEETHGAQLQPLRHCPKSLDSHQPRALLARNAMQQVICYLAARPPARTRPPGTFYGFDDIARTHGKT